MPLLFCIVQLKQYIVLCSFTANRADALYYNALLHWFLAPLKSPHSLEQKEDFLVVLITAALSLDLFRLILVVSPWHCPLLHSPVCFSVGVWNTVMASVTVSSLWAYDPPFSQLLLQSLIIQDFVLNVVVHWIKWEALLICRLTMLLDFQTKMLRNPL